MAKRTKYPGVKRLPDGRFKLRVSMRAPVTGRKVFRERTLEPAPVHQILAARAQMMAELQAELTKKKEDNPKNARMSGITTVADYAEHWMKRRVRRLKPSVQSLYARVLADRFLPSLGGAPIRGLTRDHVVQWLGEIERMRNPKTKSHYATDTLRGWWRTVRTMLKDAAADLGFPDPTIRLTPPASPVRAVRERRTLSGSQLGVFVETARKHFADWFPEIHVLVFSGMRPGELHALRWKDVDLDRACINLQRAVWAGHEGATKTGDGREIALPVAVCDVLRARRQSKGAPEGNVLVFPNASGGHRFASALYKTLRLCSDVAGMPFRVTPQVLRRTFNTLMVEAGVNQVVLRSQMGHSSEAMTHRYAGVHIERKLEAVELIVAQAAVD